MRTRPVDARAIAAPAVSPTTGLPLVSVGCVVTSDGVRALAGGEAPFATCPITRLALLRFLVREGTRAAHPDVADLVEPGPR